MHTPPPRTAEGEFIFFAYMCGVPSKKCPQRTLISHRKCSVIVTSCFFKASYPEEYSTSNDISYRALGSLFYRILLIFKQKNN